MNETLQKAVALMIEKAVAGVDTATSFLTAEVPDVIHQLVLWHMAKNAAIVITCLFILSAFAWALLKMYRWEKKKEYRGDLPVTEALGVFGGTGSVFSLFHLFDSSITLLKLWIAPKVWLLEYAGSLLK